MIIPKVEVTLSNDFCNMQEEYDKMQKNKPNSVSYNDWNRVCMRKALEQMFENMKPNQNQQ